ncbi:hypothetical protein DLAC_01852 [Tieghemostelium lacteum]|uniref:Uncharacterized protein n=1 Tax=Tieghemostelium lacteum TaxID=361077 RepID=A0A152A6S9_TIELA|nr:hypothetical protein DLAC_01852 [Tieghemostelium lacteum]|eukprot:KYR01835.1 hypothetical protein DLAC_01852 [Tieghemostelium lacteum]
MHSRYLIFAIILIITIIRFTNAQPIELQPPSNKEFYCFGNSNATDADRDNRNELYYPALPTQFENTDHKFIQSSVRYIPEGCQEFLHERSNRDKRSCCMTEQQDRFQFLLERIFKASKGALIDCPTKEWLPLPNGFREVSDTGQTPDLEAQTTNPYIRVYDTRYHVKTCIDHLQKLQCYKCSQDHNTILREPNVFLNPTDISNLDNQPLFYINANYTRNSLYQQFVGKSVTLCLSYYEQLKEYCSFISFKEIEFESYYTESLKNFYEPANDGYSNIDQPKIVRKLYVSPDLTDAFYVSNANCFKLPIEPFEPPVCSLIHNGTFMNDYRSNIEKDINGRPIDSDIQTSQSSSLLSTILTLKLHIVIFTIIIIHIYLIL